uniref:Citrate synthase n=1 Tax=Rhodosorus marinus TaxID=101924 RepID=A0A7S0BIW6_9RHOD|mmetsp:Transcript_17762/g.25613  ORF Transcript_17762/g.25613 Transcript_17762/m.25613 type:complete len:474 (+) Transcript_17762:39-1460(+)
MTAKGRKGKSIAMSVQIYEVRESQYDRGDTGERRKGAFEEKKEKGVVEASWLRKQGVVSYDPGYTNTACCTSRITYLDGERGILRYRGYPIEQLAGKSSFLEVAYTLYYGELPTEQDLRLYEANVAAHRTPHNDLLKIISNGFRSDAHPMGVLASTVMAMGTLYPEVNPALQGNHVYESYKVREKQVFRILGTMPMLVASIYRSQNGLAPMVGFDTDDMTFTERFLCALSWAEGKQYKPNKRLARALDILFILHADHELNCSTATMRQLTSSGVDVYTSVAASIGALYGPLHGGATEAVLKMLERIKTVDNIPAFLNAVKNREEKLMGFGHRVYRNYDPRAKIIKKIAYEVFEEVGQVDPLIDLATELERAALTDEYFVKRKLYPNVDFYSGLIYKAIGFPTEYFPCLFAIGRTAGWLAHWNEFLVDPEKKIARPTQLYKGHGKRDYVQVFSRWGKRHNSRISSQVFAGRLKK